MTLKLNILPRAERDAQRIFDWIAEKSPGGANRWYAALDDAARKVTVNPEAYGLAPESEQVDCELRQFLFKTRRGRIYRGVFTIVADEVRVLRIRGPGQPPLDPDEVGQ